MTIYELEERNIIYNAHFAQTVVHNCDYCLASWCCMQDGKPEKEIDRFECGYQQIIGTEYLFDEE